MKPIGENRFLLLETIREFSGSRLDDAERAALVTRHAAYYLGLAESLAPRLTGADGPALIAQLDADHANLRVALDNTESPVELARMTSALWRFWLVRGHFHEAQTRIERVLALELDDAARADLQYELGAILISRGRSIEGEEAVRERARPLPRRRQQARRGEGADGARALDRATAASGSGRAATTSRRSRSRAPSARSSDVAGGLGDLAGLLLHVGKADEALPIAAESVEVQRHLGFEQGVAVVQTTQAYAYLMTGDRDRARELFVESLRIAHRGGYQHGLVYCLNGLGRLFCESDDLDRAAQAFAAAQRSAGGDRHRARSRRRSGRRRPRGARAAARRERRRRGCRAAPISTRSSRPSPRPRSAVADGPERAVEQGFSADIVIVRNASFAGISVPATVLVTFQ